MTRRVLVVLAALVLAAGVTRLRFDAEVLHLLPSRLPVVEALLWHQKAFANGSETLVTLSGTDSALVGRAAEAVAARLRGRTNEVQSVQWQPPWLERPEDAAENLAWIWLQRDPRDVAALVEGLEPGRIPERLTGAVRELATSLDPRTLAMMAYDPLGFAALPGAAGLPGGFDDGGGLFVGDEGRLRVISLQPAHPRMDYRAAAGWVESLRSEVEAAVATVTGGDASVRIGLTGGPVFGAEIASGMERDLRNSVLTTVAVIGLLFWLAHRSWWPLGCLVLSLGVTLLITLALGGLFLGTLNMVSAGFAAVLIGLVVDYGLVAYQEARVHPGLPVAEVRRRVAPGVGWSAVTTAGTFGVLGWAGLPGLAQLGLLTGLGLLVGAAVMLYGFLPLALLRGLPPSPGAGTDGARGWGWLGRAWVTIPVWVSVVLVLVGRGWPPATSSSDPLRPRQSLAYEAMDRLQTGLGRTNDTVWLMFRGATPEAVGRLMQAAEPGLAKARSEGGLRDFQLPSSFWPDPARARTNLVRVQDVVRRGEGLRKAVLGAGFSTNSTALFEGVLACWQRWGATGTGVPEWPANPTADWLRARCAGRTPAGEWLALGLATPVGSGGAIAGLPDGVIAASWNRLGEALWGHVVQRVGTLTVLLAAVLVVMLWLAFRRVTEVLLSVAALVTAFALLLAGMSVLGASWNLLNLVAIPLLLGSSVDSTIHVQLAMRRHGADRWALWASTGRALVLCAGANMAGFGSLAWSNNAGLASLDLVCAGGVACVLVVALGLLPSWWLATGLASAPGPGAAAVEGPSGLYQPGWWKAGHALARRIPRRAVVGVGGMLGWIYGRFHRRRAAVVAANLAPVVGPGPGGASRAAATFREFGMKVADLLRFEAGGEVDSLVRPGAGWEHFEQARASGRGILLVTVHLGNWEFGSVLLRRAGMKPLVLTAPEPGRRFTELRAAARARWGIDTLVVGEDPFQFVAVIRRLQEGGVVALLVDRPPAGAAVPADFLGQSISANVAPAELARATGCLILPVVVVRRGGIYETDALPPVDYDPRALGNRAARVELAGRILRAFEGAVRNHPEQWFHFVPVWSGSSSDERPTQPR